MDRDTDLSCRPCPGAGPARSVSAAFYAPPAVLFSAVLGGGSLAEAVADVGARRDGAERAADIYHAGKSNRRRDYRIARPSEHHRLSGLVYIDVAEDPWHGRRLKADARVVGVVCRRVDALASDCDLRRKGLRIPRDADFVLLILAILYNLNSPCPELGRRCRCYPANR